MRTERYTVPRCTESWAQTNAYGEALLTWSKSVSRISCITAHMASAAGGIGRAGIEGAPRLVRTPSTAGYAGSPSLACRQASRADHRARVGNVRTNAFLAGVPGLPASGTMKRRPKGLVTQHGR